MVRAGLGQGGCAVVLGSRQLPIYETQTKGVIDGLGAASESLIGQGWPRPGWLLRGVGSGELPRD